MLLVVAGAAYAEKLPVLRGMPPATGCPIQRGENGRILRNRAAIRAFRKVNPCPSTNRFKGACPGWVVDHIWPLCAGGCDEPQNLQFQTKDASKRKDRLEVFICLRGPGGYP